jgi:septal ring factor EnvC (AmiA/AmiB activator)
MRSKNRNCATIELANNRDMSDMATANEVNRSLRTRKGRSLGRITFSTLLGPLMAVGFLTAFIPMSAAAEPGGVPAEIAALQAQVAALQTTVSTLQTSNTNLQAQVAALQTTVSTLQTTVSTLQNELAASKTHSD